MYEGVVITDEVKDTCIEIIKAGMQNAMSDGKSMKEVKRFLKP